MEKTWQPGKFWPMECDSFKDFRLKLNAPPQGYHVHSWHPRPPYEHFYTIVFEHD